MKTWTLFVWGVLWWLYMHTAMADAMTGAPSGVSLGQPALGGNGCPAGSASVVLSPDHSSLSILFDSYQVEAGGVTGKTIDRKTCNLAIPMHIPGGYSVSVLQVDYRGYNGLPPGARSQFNVEYFFAGSSGILMKKDFLGPLNENFLFTNQLPTGNTVWSTCGADVNIRVNSNMMVMTNSYREQALSTVDSADVQAALLYLFQWKRCGDFNEPTRPPGGGGTIITPLPPVMPPIVVPQLPLPQNNPQMSQCGMGYPGYAIQEFRQWESEMLTWNQRYSSLNSWTWEAKEADRRRRSAGQMVLDRISSQDALSGFTRIELENFALELDRKYSNVNSWTYSGEIYNKTRQIVWNALVERTNCELHNAWGGFRELLSSAREFDQKYSNVNSWTTAGSTYQKLRQQAWTLAYVSLQSELSPNSDMLWDFKNLENLGREFDREYGNVNSWTLAGGFFDKARRLAYQVGLERFKWEARMMDRMTLDRIQSEYSQKASSVNSWTAYGAFTQSVRDEARRLISSFGWR